MLSMTGMKHDAIVDSGIPILERIPILHGNLSPSPPQPEMEPCADSGVEIDAKVNARYFTTGEVCTEDQLAQVKGHGLEPWEDAVFSVRGNIVKEIGVE
ncbi:hypothetical protein F4825DRAFT_458145 [Nemania diffusa]|nr:hypothetical protein F4825DRAFT_458145 [Nemania diffusa]